MVSAWVKWSLFYKDTRSRACEATFPTWYAAAMHIETDWHRARADNLVVGGVG